MVQYYLVYIPFTPLTANDFLGLVGGEQMPGFKVSTLLVMKLVPWVSIKNPAPYRYTIRFPVYAVWHTQFPELRITPLVRRVAH